MKGCASVPSSPSEADYRAQDDHRTLASAEEIKGSPERMKGVAKHHRKEKRKLAGVGRSLGMKR